MSSNLEILCIEGEEIEEEFLEIVRQLPSEFHTNNILVCSTQKAATSFVELAIRLAPFFRGQEGRYIGNMAKLFFKLIEKDGFYERFTREIDHTDSERIPKEARLFLYALR